MKGLNKKIWFLWFQGKSKMPEVVETCYNSWCKHNKNWEIIFLSHQNINDYLEIESIIPQQNNNISVQAQSDIIRINLLNKYGGIWVDSTCFCMKPLDSWLEEKMTSGFFAFSKPGKDRMISSWFLAAKQRNRLAEIYCRNVNEFWSKNKKIKPIKSKHITFLHKSKLNYLFSIKPTLWYSPIFINFFKLYHYFWFHYLFEILYKKNSDFREIWNQTPKVSADHNHKLLFFGLNKPISKELQNEIELKETPLYKLSWRIEFDSKVKNSVYNYLVNIK